MLEEVATVDAHGAMVESLCITPNYIVTAAIAFSAQRSWTVSAYNRLTLELVSAKRVDPDALVHDQIGLSVYTGAVENTILVAPLTYEGKVVQVSVPDFAPQMEYVIPSRYKYLLGVSADAAAATVSVHCTSVLKNEHVIVRFNAGETRYADIIPYDSDDLFYKYQFSQTAIYDHSGGVWRVDDDEFEAYSPECIASSGDLIAIGHSRGFTVYHNRWGGLRKQWIGLLAGPGQAAAPSSKHKRRKAP